MSTLTNFFIKTDKKDIVLDQLKALTSIANFKMGDYPTDIHDNYLFDEKAKPTYLAVARTTPDWITISHNSFNNLSEWSKIISKNLKTKVIVTIAQSVSDATIFLCLTMDKKSERLNFAIVMMLIQRISDSDLILKMISRVKGQDIMGRSNIILALKKLKRIVNILGWKFKKVLIKLPGQF